MLTSIPSSQQRPTPIGLLLIFGTIGLTSFGGGLSGWFMREFVRKRRWMAEEDFLNGLAMAQALPGVDATNMAVWIGHALCGLRGAVASLVGIVVPPAMLIVGLDAFFASIQDFPSTHRALDGAAAAAVGLSLSLAGTTALRVKRKPRPLAIMAGTFLAIGPMRQAVIPVVLVAGSIGIALEAFRPSDG